MDPATEVARRRALGGKAERVRVVVGELGEDVGAVGAAALVLREAFAAPARRRRPRNVPAVPDRGKGGRYTKAC